MKAYKVTLPNYPPFTYITDTTPDELPAAVLERFLCEAIAIKAL
jgi:hypothetical protein